jgi:TonB family protein
MTAQRGGKFRSGLFLGIACAVALHAGVILFGGAIFTNYREDRGSMRQVELISENDIARDQKEKEKPVDKAEKLETESEKAPDAAEIIRNMELETARTPALEAASLSSIEAALSGLTGGGGDFAESLSFASGGVIGGTGKAGAMDKGLEDAFSLSEIDQKPRVVFQAMPIYPAAMRPTEGVVKVLFVVDSSGKVTMPRVESSTHQEFDKPAIEAVKQWKFEPAIKAGQRVACKMRAPIRFKPR